MQFPRRWRLFVELLFTSANHFLWLVNGLKAFLCDAMLLYIFANFLVGKMLSTTFFGGLLTQESRLSYTALEKILPFSIRVNKF